MSALPDSSLVLDIEALRADTPGCQYVTHFNNAGASLPSYSTLKTIKNYLDRESEIGGYETAYEYQEEINDVYKNVAHLINAGINEIAMMNSATDAWNSIFYSLDFRPGDRILTSTSEYASNYLAILQQSNRLDIKVDIIPDNESGEIDTEQLKQMLTDQVRLVALTHIPTNNGLVNPAEEVGHILKHHRACYLLDACQSVGQVPIDVNKIRCDFLTATGRKYLRGPRGTGFLYVQDEHLSAIEPAQLDIRSADWVSTNEYEIEATAKKFERWEHSHALRLGLKQAVSNALDLGLDQIEARITYLANLLRGHLNDIPTVSVRDKGIRQCGIVTFDIEGISAVDVVTRLRKQTINTSVSPASMARLDMEPRGLDAVIRSSVHYYNTESEIEKLINALNSIIKSK